MARMFGGGGRPVVQPKAKPVRMPVQNNATLAAANARQVAAASNRTGRSSTILTDALRSITGSSGKLGR